MTDGEYQSTIVMLGGLLAGYFAASYIIEKCRSPRIPRMSFGMRAVSATLFSLSAPVVLNHIIMIPGVLSRILSNPSAWHFSYAAINDSSQRIGLMVFIVALIAVVFSLERLVSKNET